MKILVFEYICGGGLAGQALPESLLAEGSMMLQALVDDLKSLAHLDLLLPLDQRCKDLSLPANAQIITIGHGSNALSLLPGLIAGCDAVWLIAPETDGLLAAIAGMVITQGKILLSPPPQAVALCADKLATFQVLESRQIPVAETRLLTASTQPFSCPCVIKPQDGIGCQGGMVAANSKEFQLAVASLEPNIKYITQPFYTGQAVSLSCLFRRGQGWLLCCNQQQIEIVNSRFSLRACLVNIESMYRDFYRNLVERIAIAIPDLWGYIGIDIIETADGGPLVLEINPRLTTSYAGIRQATGINVAEQVLALLHSEPDLQSEYNRTITVNII